MTLIKSISGIRGTIGGKSGEGLTPIDIIKFTSAYALFISNIHKNKKKITVVIGRDARVSGLMVSNLVSGALMGMGIDVIDLGLSTTPTVEVAVPHLDAHGGIILTASHNPAQWNALKLLNSNGEFLSDKEGREILRMAEAQDFTFAGIERLGSYQAVDGYIRQHIRMVTGLDLVNVEAIRDANFTVAVDAVNSTGGLAIPALLEALGVTNVVEVNCKPDGHFPHNPEPLPENLKDLSTAVKENQCHVGFAVDPDVDRLAIVQENGEMFGEEYTLVAVADYILQKQKGDTVSNLSSTKSLREITEKAGGQYHAAAVGEVNVVEMMKKTGAVIGGEGNGGVIYPEFHYGRDALAGIALFLSYLATSGKSCSALRDQYPRYHISKNKMELPPAMDVDVILENVQKKYSDRPTITIDGLKIEFDNGWVHLRKSNTEPIIRIYSESDTEADANQLAEMIINDIRELTDE